MKSRVQQQNITAIIYDKRGKILSIGKNSYLKTHPLMLKHGTKVGMPDRIFVHAEVDALVRCRDLRKAHRIFITRVMKDGSYGLAKPCAICHEALKKETNIKIIEWTL
jgi:deoxycytidylate deaminase